ncbi:IQ and ubiquitin-like domain-containing protein [Denticeps clupeoides]|uniref:IQ and ubiquitin-like domain-containing protein n=1 Tax=Denticeps clupeoides TaxID=299321 RepID=UPI0010A48385|nr:IQ and ubiquitin-like domain-containing protein [Denticeps clupeoides]
MSEAAEENVAGASLSSASDPHARPASPREPEQDADASDVGSSTATVKIMLMPDGHMMTVAFTIGLSTEELKKRFAAKLKVPPEVIQLHLDGTAVEDNQTLIDLGVQPHGTVQLEMTSSDPEKHPIRPVKHHTEYNMPDVITVRVQTGMDDFQDVVVEIERATQRKAFLGGYRHKMTKTEFHNAAVQTVPKRRPDKGVELFSRSTQTVKEKNQAQQCNIHTYTQTNRAGFHMSRAKDKLITPGPYVTADEQQSERLKAVLTLQTHWRRWQAKRLTDQLSLERKQRLDWMERERVRKKQEKEELVRAENHRKMNPQTKEDFALLYNALESWRKEQQERINATLTGPELKAALCELQEQEAQFIAAIDRHHTAAREKSHSRAVQDFLDKCAAPKRWRAFDGKTTQMDTPYTIRARALRDLYNRLNLPDLRKEERLEVLLALKDTVKENNCKLTKDIVELADREVDLSNRGVKKANLDGLRKRISTLFLQYIKNPTFNPEASKVLKVPQDPAHLKKVFFCHGCHRYLQPTDFGQADGTVLRCRRCSQLDVEARHREDFSHYKSILKQLHKTEAEFSHKAKIIYLMQEQDLHYLVCTVWGAHSAINACSDLRDLMLVRWDRLLEWSPWNCILLTKDEATAHLKVENTEQEYSTTFISNIKHKHMLARQYFSQNPAMAEYLNNVTSHHNG